MKNKTQEKNIVNSVALYTGFYQNLIDEQIDSDFFCISISGGNLEVQFPKYFSQKDIDLLLGEIDFQEKKLAPSWSIYLEYAQNDDLKSREERYVKRFLEERIKKIDLKELVFGLIEKAKKAEKKGIIFFCYEDTNDFCHRHIVAEEISRLFGIEIPEYTTGQTERKKGRLV